MTDNENTGSCFRQMRGNDNKRNGSCISRQHKNGKEVWIYKPKT